MWDVEISFTLLWELWCMDAAKWASHPHSTGPDVGCNGRRLCSRVGAVSIFFLIQVDLRCLGPIHAEIVETHQFRSFRCRTGWFRSKFKKRKKEKEKVQNAPFELNNKTLNYLSSQPNSFFNLQLSLTLCAPQSPLGSLLSVSPFSQTHLVTP